MPAHQPTRIAIPATRHRHLDPIASLPRRRSLPRHHQQLPRILTLMRGVILVLALLAPLIVQILKSLVGA